MSSASKRRQTVSPAASKRCKVENIVSEEILKMTDKDLRMSLVSFGETPGPIMPGTRELYERKLQMLCEDKQNEQETAELMVIPEVEREPPKEPPKPPATTPARNRSSRKSQVPKDRTPLSPPAEDDVEGVGGGGGGGGPAAGLIVNTNRKTPKSRNNGSNRRNTKTIMELGNLLDKYKESQEIPNSPANATCNIGRTPYKSNRKFQYDARFEGLDFVMFATSPNPPSRPSYYQDLLRSSVQCVVLRNTNQNAMQHARDASNGMVLLFASVTVRTLQEEKLEVKRAYQTGCDAVVLSLGDPHCEDAKGIAEALTGVMEWADQSAFFYHHNSLTKACPISICKHLRKNNKMFQGIFISAECEEQLLQLEALGIKFFETDTTKVLRSLAHGVDSFASYEGVIAMPVIRKLKEEFYEGNTSESCKLQLALCRFCRILRSHGDFLACLHSAIHMLKKESGDLPIPLSPIKNDAALLKELKELKLEEWQHAHM